MKTLSDLAHRLLQLHAGRAGRLFYGTDVLGSMFRDADIARLDTTYAELVERGLMEPSGSVISYFGDPKPLFRLTESGAEAVVQESAA